MLRVHTLPQLVRHLVHSALRVITRTQLVLLTASLVQSTHTHLTQVVMDAKVAPAVMSPLKVQSSAQFVALAPIRVLDILVSAALPANTLPKVRPHAPFAQLERPQVLWLQTAISARQERSRAALGNHHAKTVTLVLTA